MKMSNVFFALILFVGLAVSGCKKSPMDIQVSDLKTACEFVDALESLMDEMIAVKGSAKAVEELGASEQEKRMALAKKIAEIKKGAESKFSNSEAEKCGHYGSMQDKVKQLSGWLD
jgi:hypothetical protein